MMRRALAALLLTAPLAIAPLPATAQANGPAQAGAVTPVVLPKTESWLMQAANGRTYRIFVALPSMPPPPGGYPVIYTLDANIMFATMVDTVRTMERRPNGQAAIVVGVGYADDKDAGRERAFDLTPRLGSPEPTMPGSGGAEAFLEFVADRLKPEITRRYRIDASQETLFGHSFGGLFALYALVNNPGLFDNWVAASPSIWFENHLMRKDNVRKRLAPKLAATGATPRVLITVGQYEQAADPDFPPPKLEGLLARNQVENSREFAAFLNQPGVTVKFEELANEDHGTVIPVAISRAVRWVLAGAKAPARAPKPAAWINRTGVPIPDAASYLAMTPEQRYKLRLRSRKIPASQHAQWVAEFDRMLNSGLTYRQHRALAEERNEMDAKHGTKPVD